MCFVNCLLFHNFYIYIYTTYIYISLFAYRVVAFQTQFEKKKQFCYLCLLRFCSFVFFSVSTTLDDTSVRTSITNKNVIFSVFPLCTPLTVLVPIHSLLLCVPCTKLCEQLVQQLNSTSKMKPKTMKN